ncbi:hypothetical protein F5Y18DRAFT_440744 [Xylariaceae sp. FL1019]|nr:hypothetical protein F5Y18DRAFT_440744 [Xylariaceae sp. FL1019]
MASFASASSAPKFSHKTLHQVPLVPRNTTQCAWNITTQNDIDVFEKEIVRCSHGCETPSIYITNATGHLTFATLSVAYEIVADDNPGLEVMDFSNLSSVVAIQVRSAPSLVRMSFPKKQSLTLMSFINTPSLLLAPSPVGDSDVIQLYNVGSRSKNTRVGLDGFVEIAGQFSTDSCMAFGILEVITDILTLNGTAPNCNILPSLKSVKDLTIENATFESPLRGSTQAFESPLRPIQVNNTMVISNVTGHSLASFDSVSNINSNLSIDAASSLNVTFNSLTSIGSTLSVANNTNCTFSFEKLTSITDLVLVDNVESIIPSFPSLQAARNIHMRGYIDTSNGYNIFPSLTHAPGSVIIEPWNTVFDCSTLVAQQKNLVINQLRCNGKNNGTSTSTPNPPSPTGNVSSGLSSGAQAGIGAGAGVFGIGFIIAVIWLLLHYKRRLDKLELAQTEQEQRKSRMTDLRATDVPGLHETTGMGLVSEISDEPLIELPILATEFPDDPLVEMPVRETELSTSPQLLFIDRISLPES